MTESALERLAKKPCIFHNTVEPGATAAHCSCLLSRIAREYLAAVEAIYEQRPPLLHRNPGAQCLLTEREQHVVAAYERLNEELRDE